MCLRESPRSSDLVLQYILVFTTKLERFQPFLIKIRPNSTSALVPKKVSAGYRYPQNDIPECASDKSNTFMPLSIASDTICSACSSVTPGPKIGHVPSPMLETRSPLFPRFRYRKPGVREVCLES
uniref:Uncharacterized protein n=1 Tax=Photinus pyralis TaxID=7054 RepID=A0A1Y1N872_PHOPY